MKSKSSLIYFFITLALLCVFTLGKWRFYASNLEKNFEKYEPIDVEVVTVNLDRFGYYAIIKNGDEICKKHIPISDIEADRLYSEMKYDMENANRKTPIIINVRKDKKNNFYSEEEYNRLSTNKNPDGLFYTILFIISIGITIKLFTKKDIRKK